MKLNRARLAKAETRVSQAQADREMTRMVRAMSEAELRAAYHECLLALTDEALRQMPAHERREAIAERNRVLAKTERNPAEQEGWQAI